MKKSSKKETAQLEELTLSEMKKIEGGKWIYVTSKGITYRMWIRN